MGCGINLPAAIEMKRIAMHRNVHSNQAKLGG